MVQIVSILVNGQHMPKKNMHSFLERENLCTVQTSLTLVK